MTHRATLSAGLIPRDMADGDGYERLCCYVAGRYLYELKPAGYHEYSIWYGISVTAPDGTISFPRLHATAINAGENGHTAFSREWRVTVTMDGPAVSRDFAVSFGIDAFTVTNALARGLMLAIPHLELFVNSPLLYDYPSSYQTDHSIKSLWPIS